MPTLDHLARIAQLEFADVVVDTGFIGVKLRIFLTDTSYIDIWLSRKLSGRFGFHWERGHLDGTIYRYDNFPNTSWQSVSTYPYHFHDGSQTAVVAASFSLDVEQGFRDFMGFVRERLH
jgi:hypothetical protein